MHCPSLGVVCSSCYLRIFQAAGASGSPPVTPSPSGATTRDGHGNIRRRAWPRSRPWSHIHRGRATSSAAPDQALALSAWAIAYSQSTPPSLTPRLSGTHVHLLLAISVMVVPVSCYRAGGSAARHLSKLKAPTPGSPRAVSPPPPVSSLSPALRQSRA